LTTVKVAGRALFFKLHAADRRADLNAYPNRNRGVRARSLPHRLLSSPNERICRADVWPDIDVTPDGLRPNTSSKRWETFVHEARLALDAAEIVRERHKS
jgi:hypothetical protein